MAMTRNFAYFITSVLLLYGNVVVFLDIRVKPVFNSILWASFYTFANLWPFWAELTILFDDYKVLGLCPFLFLYLWIKLVYKALAYLFATFGAENIGNSFPVISIMLEHFFDYLILLSTPYFLRFAYFN
jgi:hypothetical protein